MTVISDAYISQRASNYANAAASHNLANNHVKVSTRDQQLSNSISKKSLRSQRSKGILPTLNDRADNTSVIEDIHKEIDQEQQRRIEDQLHYSAFQGQQLMNLQSKSLDGHFENYRHWQSDYLTQDQLAASVTLKDGWRKVLLPGIDMRDQNKRQREQQQVRNLKLSNDLADQIIQTHPQSSKKKLDRLNKQKLDYEQKRIKSVVNEANIAGRQSVKNLLQIYTPDIKTLEQSQTKFTQQLPNKTSLLPALDQHSASTPCGSISNDYQMRIQSHLDGGNSIDNDQFQKQMLTQSPSAAEFIKDPRGIKNNHNNVISKRQTTLRNSEGYVLYRSQNRPIKRVLLHQELSLLEQSPIAQKSTNPSFTNQQLLSALDRKTVNRSISPINYDNRLGYAPRTVRLFNTGRAAEHKNNRNVNVDGSSMTKIADKMLNKDNIFVSVAQTEANSRRYKQNKYSRKQLQPDAVHDYASLQFLDQREQIIQSKKGRHVEQQQQQQQQQHILSKTENPSVASLIHNQSSSSILSLSQEEDGQRNNKVSFKVENQKDWAPLELASRSQLYISSSTPQAETPNSRQKNTFASLLENKSQQESLQKLHSYIKVRNMKRDSTYDFGTLEEEAEDLLKPVELFGQVNNNNGGPDYGDLMLSQRSKTDQAETTTQKEIQSEEQEIVIDVANQGTQAIDENSDEMTVQNDEDWANAVTELVNQTSEDLKQVEVEVSSPTQARNKRLLVNVASTRIIPDQDYLMVEQDLIKKNKHQSSNKAENTEAGVSKLREPNKDTSIDGQSKIAANLSSTSTMRIVPIQSQMKRPTALNQTSMEKLRLQNILQAGGSQETSQRSRRSLNRQNSNTDIKDVLEEVSDAASPMKSKPITMTDFKVKGMQKTQTIKLDPNQSEFNKSQLFLQVGKAGFAAGFVINNRNLQSGLGQNNTQPTENNTNTDIVTDDRSAIIKKPMLEGIQNTPIHPQLLEALKKTKHVRIQKPIRALSKKGQIKPHKYFIGINENNGTPTVIKEQATNAMLDSTSVANLESVRNSQDSYMSPQKPLVSKMDRDNININQPYNNPSSSPGRSFESPTRQMDKFDTQELLRRQHIGLSTLNESTYSYEEKSPQIREKKDKLIVNSNQNGVTISPSKAKKKSGIVSGVTSLKTRQEVSPKNMELNLQKQIQSKLTQSYENAQAKKMKTQLAQNGSMASFKKEKNAKKVVFANKKQMFSPRDLESAFLNPMMHIQEIVRSNRYDVPQIEKKNSGTQLDITMYTEDSNKHNMVKIPIGLIPINVSTLADDQFDTRKVSQENCEDDSKGATRTMIEFSSEGGNINTQMQMRDELSQGSPTKISGLAKLQVVKDNGDIVIESKEFGNHESSLLLPQVKEGVYPIEISETILRRSAEKFLPKSYQKIMVLKPLRTRKNTGLKNNSAAPITKKGLQSHQASVSTVTGQTTEMIITKMNNGNGINIGKELSRVDESQKVKSTFAGRNHQGKQVVFNTIEVRSLPQSKDSNQDQQLSIQQRFDSKGSKLSGDLEHLESYAPGIQFGRIYEDPLEKTTSNFSYGRSPSDKQGTVFRNSKLDMKNKESVMTENVKMQSINMENHNHGGLVIQKMQSQASEERRIDGSSQLMLPDSNSLEQQQRALQIQTSFEELQLSTAKIDESIPTIPVDYQSVSQEHVTFQGSDTPRSSVQVANLISVDALGSITPAPHFIDL